MTTTSSTTATTISNFVNGTTNINYNSRGFLPNNNVYDDDYSNHHPLQQYFTTANNECLPNQYTESDDEVYFSQSPMKSKFNLKSSLLPLPSSSSSLPKSRNVVINDHFDSIPHSSTSFSSISYKGHQKALSLGTGFDLCQNYSNAVTIDNSNHDNSTLFPSYEMNKKLTGHRLHRSVVKSRGRLGPPLTEDLMRKFQCITVPLKKQTEKSSKSWIYRFHSKLYVHCSRIRLVYLIMILKFTVLICFIEILYRSRGCFNWLFFSGPQKYLFQYNHEHTTNVPAHEEIADDQQTWFYRWSMDRFSAVYGMIFALLCESLRQTGVLKDTEDDHLECLLPLHNNNNNSNNYNVNNRNFTIVESDHEKRMKTQNNSADYTSSYHGSSNLLFSRSDEFLNQLFTPDDSLYEINKKYKRTVNSSIQYSNHHMEQEEREIRNDDEGLNTVNLPLLKPTTHDKDYVENSYLLREFLCKCFSPLGLTVLGIIGLMFAFIYVFACSNRETCLHIHAYVCLIPILSYILVRNSFSSLRRTYSIFFAWIGDMSLELFIAQYHIWLSADAYGILVLLPGYPLINLAVTSFIFICICHEVHILTRRLQKYVIPNSPLKLVRNVLIFTLVFHLITNSTSQMIQWDFL
ncbi:unnamed protein product [Heterobilharzia americana]|nr:unnamed protein product [Heterobilharzia americana]